MLRYAPGLQIGTRAVHGVDRCGFEQAMENTGIL